MEGRTLQPSRRQVTEVKPRTETRLHCTGRNTWRAMVGSIAGVGAILEVVSSMISKKFMKRNIRNITVITTNFT